MAEHRPDPDELLARVRQEESKKTRGKLKIFLGAAPGVGKTYAMLEAAQQRKAEGVDVVAGIVETHGRAETEALLQGLEQLPRRLIPYHGTTLREFDIDAALARHPTLILVDELAHTNAYGLLHPKRWQYVEELLDAGINVYTTVNVQHIESLNDIVAQITGIVVHETIPDSLVERADEVELVDLPPDDLLQRLKEGKVYVPEQARHAVQNFFRKGNLIALRELALRRTATRVDSQMRGYMRDHAIPGPWPASERLLVCLSPSPLAERLVRNTRHLADELRADWIALHVETPDDAHLTQAQRDQLSRSLRLAESLGAKVMTLPSRSTAATILEVARTHNITKIIAGRPLRPRWQEIFRGSVVDTLMRHSGNIDVYVVTGLADQQKPSELQQWRPHRPWQRYLYALLLVAGATLVSLPIGHLITPTNLVMVYLLATVVAAVYLGRGPSVLVAFLGVIAFDFFFVPPILTFTVADTEYLLTFLGLLVVGLVVSQLTAQFRDQVDNAGQREAAMAVLYSLSRDLAVARGLDEIMQTIVGNVSQTFGRGVVVMLPSADGSETLKIAGVSPDFKLEPNEIALASWAFQHGQPAGRGTDTLPAAKVRFLPLRTANGVLGLMGTGAADGQPYLTPEQRRLLDSFASLAALAIERVQLAEAARAAQVHEATEKLQTALLNSISHDLRTPLVSITGALSTLQDDGTQLTAPTRHTLIENAREEAERLNRIVGNLLDMTRLEAGAMKVVKQPADVQDLIGTVLEQMAGRLRQREVTVDLPADLPMAPMDFGLMVQVLVNLIDNAIKYSPPTSPIEIHARVAQDWMQIEVADRGIGIPPEDLDHVFDKFFRVQRPHSVSGTGMGLSICKGIVEAHGGKIQAENRPGGGTIIRLQLPVVEQQPVVATAAG